MQYALTFRKPPGNRPAETQDQPWSNPRKIHGACSDSSIKIRSSQPQAITRYVQRSEPGAPEQKSSTFVSAQEYFGCRPEPDIRPGILGTGNAVALGGNGIGDGHAGAAQPGDLDPAAPELASVQR